MKKLLLLLAGCAFCFSTARGADLKESKFTQVVNQVEIINSTNNSKQAAAVDALFKAPDVLRTGPASRAELVAADNTITRVGANTIFSFEGGRNVRLEKGSVLFNSPKGKGGGSIRTAAATAAVIGTTIIVSTTPDGGFKVLTMEGRAQVRYANGATQRLDAGQMSFVLPGGLPGPVIMFRLDTQVGNSTLVKGFTKPLESQAKVEAAVGKQMAEIESGRVSDTGLLVGDEASSTGVKVIKLFDEVSASSTNGTIPGLNDGEVQPSKPTLPPGFAVPPRLVFAEDTGGFTATNGNGTLFVSSGASGTNAATPIEYAAGPADAALDPQSISTPPGPTDPLVFRQPVDIFAIDDEGQPTHVLYPGFMGYIGQGITISTPTMDLNQYAPMDHFDFLSIGDLHITGDFALSAAEIPNGVFFSATEGHRILIDSGRTVTLDAPSVFMASSGNISFDGVTLRKLNNAGFLDLSSDADVTLNNSSVSGGDVQINSGGAMAVTGTTPTSGGVTGVSSVRLASGSGMNVNVDVASDPNSGSTTLVNSSGLLTVGGGAALKGSTVTVNSGGGVTLNNATITANQASVSGGSFFGVDGVTIQNSTFTVNGGVNIQNNRNPLAVSGSQITAGSIQANSGPGMTLNNNTLNASGAVNLSGGNAFTLADTAISGNSVRLATSGALTTSRTVATAGEIKGNSSVTLNSGNGMTLGANVTAGTAPGAGSISVNNSSGQFASSPTVALTGGSINVTSPDGISLNNNTVSGNQATLNAGRSFGGGEVSVQNSTLNLTGTLNANSRAGVTLNNNTITAGQANFDVGDFDDDDADGVGPLTISGTTFDLTGGMSVENNTGVLTINNASRVTAAGFVSMDSRHGIAMNGAQVTGGQISLSSGNEDGTGTITLQNSTFTGAGGVDVVADSVGLNNATLQSSSGGVRVQSGAVTMNNTILEGSSVTVDSGSFITAPNVAPNNGRITGDSSVNLTAQSGGMTLGVNVSANAASGSINIVNNGGGLNVSGGKTFQAAFVNVTSPGGLLFDNTTINSGTRVTLTSGNQPGTLAVVQNTSFTGAADVNIAGHTVVLADVGFSAASQVSLRSANGQLAPNPNTGQQVQGGFVNFIQNVTKGGQPAQNFIGNGITIGPLQ